MTAGSLFLLAILVPIILAVVLLGPVYLGIFAATYIVYTPAEGASPILDKLTDIFYIIGAYEQLFNYWLANKASVSFIEYTLPIVGLPAVCVLLGLWLTRTISHKFLDVFYGFAAGH